MVELFLSKLEVKQWFLGSRWHRVNGPAVLWADGHCEWYQNGLLHRSNGPAIVRVNGKLSWYWYGYEVTEYEHMMLAEQEQAYG